MKFKKGDRVTRPKNVYLKGSGLMHGVVVRAYDFHDPKFGYYPELYSVLWDGEIRPRRGYLPHGLNREVS